MIRVRSLLRPACLAAALSGAPAFAQDSFVRAIDSGNGEPMLSILGTGMGLDFATLVVELRCPAARSWTVEVTGIRAAEGTPVAFGFGDAAGRWSGVQVAPVVYGAEGLRISLDRESFRAALAQARAAGPAAQAADARVVIGHAVGLSVDRDELVREMTDFARDCEGMMGSPPEPPPGPQAARR